MGQRWKRQVLILIVSSNICQIIGLTYNDDNTDITRFEFPEAETYFTNDLNKRLSKFVRIGRGLSSFIRIGRPNPYEDVDVYQTDEIPDEIDDELVDKSAFFDDINPDNIDAEKPTKRMSSFVRIGKAYDDVNSLETNSYEKRGGAFIRMGKFPSTVYLRNRAGRVHALARQPYYRRTGRIGHSSFIRIGKRDTTDALRRMNEQEEDEEGTSELAEHYKYSEDVRGIESTDDDAENKQIMNIARDIDNDNREDDERLTQQSRRYLTNGRDVPNEPTTDFTNDLVDKRLSSIIRIGRGTSPDYLLNTDDLLDTVVNMPHKRFSNYVRIGNSGKDFNKRMSSFVRIGKSQNTFEDLLKRRTSSFVRIGKDSYPYDDQNSYPLDDQSSYPYGDQASKRMSSFVRIGKNASPLGSNADKRISSFVRIGKSSENPEENRNKRKSSFVRIGKSPDAFDDSIAKRMSSFVRIGKSPEIFGDNTNKRMSSFVRIGKDGNSNSDLAKRISSFVRIGRNYPSMEDEVTKRLSSFIRVGKDYPSTISDYNTRVDDLVRIGNNIPPLTDGIDKRISSFVRIGKNNGGNKRLSSFIRVGKDMKALPEGADDKQNSADKRVLSTFVRIGKDIDTAVKSEDKTTDPFDEHLIEKVMVAVANNKSSDNI